MIWSHQYLSLSLERDLHTYQVRTSLLPPLRRGTTYRCEGWAQPVSQIWQWKIWRYILLKPIGIAWNRSHLPLCQARVVPFSSLVSFSFHRVLLLFLGLSFASLSGRTPKWSCKGKCPCTSFSARASYCGSLLVLLIPCFLWIFRIAQPSLTLSCLAPTVAGKKLHYFDFSSYGSLYQLSEVPCKSVSSLFSADTASCLFLQVRLLLLCLAP